MHALGYEEAHGPGGGGGGPTGGGGGGGGGGGATTGAQPVGVKLRTGWSSIPFAATPRWRCLKSKKPTPVTVAVPARLVNPERDATPQRRSKVERASWMRAAPTEGPEQASEGNSAI